MTDCNLLQSNLALLVFQNGLLVPTQHQSFLRRDRDQSHIVVSKHAKHIHQLTVMTMEMNGAISIAYHY